MNWQAFGYFLSGALVMWILDQIMGRKPWSRGKRMNKQVDDITRRGL